MHTALLIILSAMATGSLLALALFIESWGWKHEIKLSLTVPDFGGHVWGRVLSGILVLAILVALGMLGYVITVPREKGLTEFYLLGLSGKAVDYPGQLMVGKEEKVMVDIINREYKTMTYRLEVRID